MNDPNVTTGRWWRWTRYEIDHGCIRPARGAQLQVYDPWHQWRETRPPARSSNQQTRRETPYQSLLTLLGELEYRQPKDIPLDFRPGEIDQMLAPLTADSETKLLAWCARHGLLGILPHRAIQVTLAPRTGMLVQYTRVGAGWITIERPIHQRQPLSPPRAVLLPLRGAGPVDEPLSLTWSHFFPDVPQLHREVFQYPQPLSKEFWTLYAEPVAEFLSGMHALSELHHQVRLFQAHSPKARRLQKLQAALLGSRHLAAAGLMAGVGLALQWTRARQVELKWVASSLLASLATMMLQDLAHGRALQCPGCGRAFVSGAYQARYCSVRCRWLMQKRAHRNLPRSARR